MTVDARIDILEDIFGDGDPSGKEIRFFCPKCKNEHHQGNPKKLSINLEKDKFRCWYCASFSGKLERLIRIYGNREQQSRWGIAENTFEVSCGSALFEKIFGVSEEPEPPLRLPEGFHSLSCDLTPASRDYRYYLFDRGINQDLINKYQIGYCSEGYCAKHVIFPSYDLEGNLNFYEGRSIFRKHFIKPSVPVSKIVFREIFVNFNDPLILVEGAIDAIKAGDNAVPILGTYLSTKSRLLQQMIAHHTPSVTLILDKEALVQSEQVAKLLHSFGICVRVLELEAHDPGEMVANSIDVEQAQPWTRLGSLKGSLERLRGR